MRMTLLAITATLLMGGCAALTDWSQYIPGILQSLEQQGSSFTDRLCRRWNNATPGERGLIAEQLLNGVEPNQFFAACATADSKVLVPVE